VYPSAHVQSAPSLSASEQVPLFKHGFVLQAIKYELKNIIY
jgi:hypothetical protein